MTDFRQVADWGEYLKTRGWKTDYVKSKDGKKQLQVLVFKLWGWPLSMIKLQRNEIDPDFDDLKRLRRKYHALQTVIEPLKILNEENYIRAGFKKSKSPFLATKTVVVDVTAEEKELWNRLSENAKRLIKKNAEMVVEDTDEKTFRREWKKYSKVWILSEKELGNLMRSFGKRAHLCVIRNGEGFHSGILILETRDVTNYFMTWTSDLGRKSGAHFRLVWEEILRAKRTGKKYFDFEGIYDPEFPIKNWKGFTEFKKKFGGAIVTHPGSFTKWF